MIIFSNKIDKERAVRNIRRLGGIKDEIRKRKSVRLPHAFLFCKKTVTARLRIWRGCGVCRDRDGGAGKRQAHISEDESPSESETEGAAIRRF